MMTYRLSALRLTPSANRRGFTLIELLVVIAVIVTLAGMGFPAYTMISNRAKNNATEAVVQAVTTAIANYSTKTWMFDINAGSSAAAAMRSYHTFDVNHFEYTSTSSEPQADLYDAPTGETPRFWSIDGYMPPYAAVSGSPTESYAYNTTTSKFTSAPISSDPARATNPSPWDVNFHLGVLNSGYRGFMAMAQPSIKPGFINKRGQIVDAWQRPLRIAFATRAYGTQGFGVWSAGLDGKDDLDSRASLDDLRSWKASE